MKSYQQKLLVLSLIKWDPSVVKSKPQAIAVFMLMELLGLSLVATVQPVDLDTKSSITLWSMERTPEYEFPA